MTKGTYFHDTRRIHRSITLILLLTVPLPFCLLPALLLALRRGLRWRALGGVTYSTQGDFAALDISFYVGAGDTAAT